MPVFPHTLSPSTAAFLPVPPVTTPRMASARNSASLPRNSSLYSSLVSLFCILPDLSLTLRHIFGSIATPPLAIPAVSMHSCMGVIMSLCWPTPLHASSKSVVGFSMLPQYATSSLNAYSPPMPSDSAVFISLSTPSSSAMHANVWLQECFIASLSVISPCTSSSKSFSSA